MTTNKAHVFDLAELSQDEDELKSVVKKIFDKSDLKSDAERKPNTHI